MQSKQGNAGTQSPIVWSAINKYIVSQTSQVAYVEVYSELLLRVCVCVCVCACVFVCAFMLYALNFDNMYL